MENILPSTGVHTPFTAWHLVQTKPRQEAMALTQLQRQGYECYMPMLAVEKLRRQRLQTVVEPMFPRYLFVQLDHGEGGKSWSPIRSTPGVQGLVRFRERAASVGAEIIDLLRRREVCNAPKPLFQAGDMVLITQGPLAGFEAVFQMSDANQRACILLEILSRPVEVRIQREHLHPVD